MTRTRMAPDDEPQVGPGGSNDRVAEDVAILTVPPAVLAVLLFVVVVLAGAFYVVAQVVQTP